MGWRRLSDEPRERVLSVHVSQQTAAELAAIAGRWQVSTNELVRYLVRQGITAVEAGTLTNPTDEPTKPAPKRSAR